MTELIKYGQTVSVKHDAPDRFRPKHSGSVISLHENESKEYTAKTGVPVGEVAVGVEFGDGVCIEIPLMWIKMAP